jgi:hypothetical protein
MVFVEMERRELNHAMLMNANWRGDIPPGWCARILCGLGFLGPGYMLEYPSLNEHYFWVTVRKIQ